MESKGNQMRDIKPDECNIVLITIDSLRTDHMSCYGYHRKTTPNIDEFSKKSIVFTNAFANGHNTSTSFPAILSSTYPLMYQDCTSHYFKPLSRERVMIAEILKQNKFLTAAFHSTPLLAQYYGYHRGFDTYQDLGASEVRDEKIARAHSQNKKGFINSTKSALKKKVKNNIIYKKYLKKILNRIKPEQTSINLPYQRAEVINEAIFSWLKHNHSKFFLWVHYMDPHYPYIPPVNYINKFTTYTPNVHELKKLWNHASMSLSPEDISNKNIKKMFDLYDAEINYLDHNIKLLLDKLKIDNIYDNTMIIITADHGEEFKDHGEFSHWPKFYDELIHVPLIIKLPNVNEGRIIEDISQHIDIPPTILGRFNIKKPNNYQGIDLLSELNNKTKIKGINERGVISETLVNNRRISKDGIGKIITSYRTKKWKLIINNETNSKELYNLNNDPEEKINIYEKNHHIVKKYEKKLKENQQTRIK